MKSFPPSLAVILLAIACNDNGSTPPVGLSADNLMLSTSAATVTVGGTYQLSIVHTHNGQTYSGNAVWQTLNAAVATVDNTGLVTAVAPGTTMIAATNPSGAQDDGSATITVLGPTLTVTGLTWLTAAPIGPCVVGVGECFVTGGTISGAPHNSPISGYDTNLPEYYFFGGATATNTLSRIVADANGNFVFPTAWRTIYAAHSAGDEVWFCPNDWAVLWGDPSAGTNPQPAYLAFTANLLTPGFGASQGCAGPFTVGQ